MDDDEENQGGSWPLSPMHLTEAVTNIIGKIIAKNSAQNYACQNTHFALYCFESTKLRIVSCSHGLSSVKNLQKCRSISEKTKYAMDCFEHMSAEDDNCPFLMSNLTFAHFSTFLST